MRKIYSLVLLAAALLVGTNVNAGTGIPVSTPDEFASAFATASTGDTIRLTTNIAQSSYVELNDGRQLVLDMQGHTLTVNYSAKPTYADNFVLKHGKLSVIGGGEIQNATTNTKDYKYNGVAIHGFYVFGTTTPGTEAYTVLEIGAGTFINNVNGKDAIEIYHVSNVAYGVEVYVAGTCFGQKYGVQLSGTVNAAPGKGTIPANATKPQYYFPYIHIQKGAEIYAHGSNPDAVGVYSGGYGIWKIEGTVHGSTGVYAKGGAIEVHDATIYSDNNTATGVQESQKSGVNAGGNAIATESNGGYAGAISVIISGESTVTGGANAYAISDTTTTASESQVTAITITGGTIEGGTNAGAVKIDESTGDVVIVEGGTFTGDISTLIDHTSDDGGSIIQDVVSTDGEGNATVVIGKPAEGSTVPAISPTAQDTIDFNFSGVDEHSIVTLKATATTDNLSYTLSGDGTTTEMQYLSLKADAGKTIAVTVAAGHTMKVGQIVMDNNAQIVVEAGAKLLVTGSNGIFANSVNNLILKANATNQALFVLSPDVTTNRQPKASVEFVSNCYYKSDESRYIWHRFAAPIEITGAPEQSASVVTYGTYISNADGGASWVELNAWSDIKPFMAASITNTSTSAGVIYTFKGKVMGNVTDDLQRKAAVWNHYGNSFMAPIGVAALLNVLPGQDIDKTIYYWDMNEGQFLPVNEGMLGDFGEGISELKAMQFFVLRNRTHEAGALNIDYANSIYDYNVNGGSGAPKRVASNNANRVRINITAENGEKDVVYLLGSDQYSAEYEDGYDAEKLMNEGMNLYVAGDMNLSMLYTDDLQGTLLSLETGDDVNYTLTFGKVNGEVYALRDNLTNAVVLMNEGATYNFTAQPNATLDGRFQIVSRQEMPTAVETIEETVAPKAIYTVMGQYVGETTDWNNLPAGVYVVDGVKVIK